MSCPQRLSFIEFVSCIIAREQMYSETSYIIKNLTLYILLPVVTYKVGEMNCPPVVSTGQREPDEPVGRCIFIFFENVQVFFLSLVY